MEKNAWNRQEKLMPLMGRRLKLEETNNKWFETQDSISYWVELIQLFLLVLLQIGN